MASITSEDLVAAITRQGNCYVLSRQFTDTVSRNRRAVRKRLIVDARYLIHECKVISVNLFDTMIGVQLIGYPLRILCFVELRVAEGY